MGAAPLLRVLGWVRVCWRAQAPRWVRVCWRAQVLRWARVCWRAQVLRWARTSREPEPRWLEAPRWASRRHCRMQMPTGK